MNATENIRYVTHAEIDLAKWDRCIEDSANGLIYGLSPYLNAMCPDWDALISGDYNAVFPLPQRRKFGLNYIFQPTLIAQLGSFGSEMNPQTVTRFINSIPRKFVYIDLPLNFLNNSGPDTRTYLRKNYVLDLDKDYETLYNAYNKNVKRNILKAIRQDCVIQKDTDIKLLTSLSEKHITDKEGLGAFEKLFEYYHAKKQATVYSVKSNTGEVLAAAAFLFFKERAYYILAGNHEHARSTGASHFLVDNFIRDHANKNLLLDFEGSDVPGIASFYTSFGASDQPYTALRWNRLPFLLRWLKK